MFYIVAEANRISAGDHSQAGRGYCNGNANPAEGGNIIFIYIQSDINDLPQVRSIAWPLYGLREKKTSFVSEKALRTGEESYK